MATLFRATLVLVALSGVINANQLSRGNFFSKFIFFPVKDSRSNMVIFRNFTKVVIFRNFIKVVIFRNFAKVVIFRNFTKMVIFVYNI